MKRLFISIAVVGVPILNQVAAEEPSDLGSVEILHGETTYAIRYVVLPDASNCFIQHVELNTSTNFIIRSITNSQPDRTIEESEDADEDDV